jgi:hypothetical protein
MAETVVHRHESGPSPEPLRIKVEKGQKGGYGWEISCAGATLEDILAKIDEADKALHAKYDASKEQS